MGPRDGGQGGGPTSQGSENLILACTRPMGPSEGDAAPLDLDFVSDSAGVPHHFFFHLHVRMEFEGESNWVG